jgi:hypothetical protein
MTTSVEQAVLAQHEHHAVCRECGDVMFEALLGADGRPTAAGWRKIAERLGMEMTTREFRGKGGMSFSYITARQVQQRLDQVVGPGNWSTSVQIIRADHPVSALVTLRVFGVEKADVGYSNNPDADDPEDKTYELEPLKAAVSDGFKRAAVQWSIGRFLYREMKP